MNDATTNSPAACAATHDEVDLCAVLVLEASGKVVAANSSARCFWGTIEKSFVGSPFAALFVLAPVSSDPEFLESLWRGLRIEALNRWIPLVAQPAEGSAREVRMRLERAVGGAGSYIATIQPAIGRLVEPR